MSLLQSILLLVGGGILGFGSTIIVQAFNNRHQTLSTQNQRLQDKRDEQAARFRPLMTAIVATIDTVQRRAVHIDGQFAADLSSLDPDFTSLNARLKAEPDCELLVIKLVNLHNVAKRYGLVEQHHYALLISLEPQAAMKTIDPLNTAAQELIDAMNVLSHALHEHMKLLDTPVG